MTKPTGWCCSLLDEENWLETKRGEHVLIISSLVVKWIFRAQWNKTLAAILLRFQLLCSRIPRNWNQPKRGNCLSPVPTSLQYLDLTTQRRADWFGVLHPALLHPNWIQSALNSPPPQCAACPNAWRGLLTFKLIAVVLSSMVILNHHTELQRLKRLKQPLNLNNTNHLTFYV